MNIYSWIDIRIFSYREPERRGPGQRDSVSRSTARNTSRCRDRADASRASRTYSRFMRASMLEVINSDYVRTARAKGLHERRVTMGHAFRNALIPLVTRRRAEFRRADRRRRRHRDRLRASTAWASTSSTRSNAGDPYPVMAWLMIAATMIIVFNLSRTSSTAARSASAAMTDPPPHARGREELAPARRRRRRRAAGTRCTTSSSRTSPASPSSRAASGLCAHAVLPAQARRHQPDLPDLLVAARDLREARVAPTATTSSTCSTSRRRRHARAITGSAPTCSAATT